MRRWLVAQARLRYGPETLVPTVTATSVRTPWVYRDKEPEIARGLGGYPLKLPYSDDVVTAPAETDVDHIVPIEEALQSGADGWSEDRWKEFQSDMANLMLSIPEVNRHEKGPKGVGEWVPEHHKMWYCWDYTLVKLAYGLTFDRNELNRIESILTGAPS